MTWLSQSKNFLLFDGDISNKYVRLIHKAKVVAWDIETSGLDWQKDRIGICQLYVIGKPVMIVRINHDIPKNLQSLLANASVKKIFHHAMFDLRFMSYHWKTIPQNVVCTKIAARLLDKNNKIEHSLRSLLKHYLDINVEKNETVRCSNWFCEKLTKEQISYVINDVIYLPPLFSILKKELKTQNLLKLAYDCFKYIPARVQLELSGWGDIYLYTLK